MPECKHFCPNVPIVLVGTSTSHRALTFLILTIAFSGNKKDLRNDEATKRELMKMKQEPVRSEAGRTMADKIGAVGYLECSAKTKEGTGRTCHSLLAHALVRLQVFAKCLNSPREPRSLARRNAKASAHFSKRTAHSAI